MLFSLNNYARIDNCMVSYCLVARLRTIVFSVSKENIIQGFHMYFDRKNFSYYSTFLIRLAWSVEVIAVCIGFMISILVSVSA